jgi:hypothetical protein
VDHLAGINAFAIPLAAKMEGVVGTILTSVDRVVPPGRITEMLAMPNAVSPGISKLTWPVEANTP